MWSCELKILKFYLFVCLLCVCEYTHTHRGTHADVISGIRSLSTMWVLGVELRLSSLAASIATHWATPPVLSYKLSRFVGSNPASRNRWKPRCGLCWHPDESCSVTWSVMKGTTISHSNPGQRWESICRHMYLFIFKILSHLNISAIQSIAKVKIWKSLCCFPP